MNKKVLCKLLVLVLISTLFSGLSLPMTAEAAEIIMDNTDLTGVTKVGSWIDSITDTGYLGANYCHDNMEGRVQDQCNIRQRYLQPVITMYI